MEQGGKIVEARRRVRMLKTERLFAYGQRALVERPRPCKVTLVMEQAGKIVEAGRRKGMIGA
jgi:hypothetical protein